MPGKKITLLLYASKYWHFSILLIRSIMFSSQTLAAVLLNTKHLKGIMTSKQAEHAIKTSTSCIIFDTIAVQNSYSNIPLITHAKNTQDLKCQSTHKHVQMAAETEIEICPLPHAKTHTKQLIKRVGGMPWEPTGVCLWGRRGQVWGHTSSVSAERRVDHTNSIMATNTAMMRPQISTTKMPPMFSMPRPEIEPQETNVCT